MIRRNFLKSLVAGFFIASAVGLERVLGSDEEELASLQFSSKDTVYVLSINGVEMGRGRTARELQDDANRRSKNGLSYLVNFSGYEML